MTTAGLSARDRRTLGRGLFIVGTLLLVGRGLPALRRIEDEWRARAERASLVIRQAERLREEAARPMPPALRTGALLEASHGGTTPVAAAAGAMAHLTDLVTGVGGSVLAVRPVADSAFRDGAAVIALQAQLSLDGDGLRALLEELEAGPKLFRVRELSVTQPAPVAPPEEPESVRVELTLEAVATLVAAGGVG